MKGNIDGNGWLYVTRANGIRTQLCPFGALDGARCGDYCPHFGEPEAEIVRDTFHDCLGGIAPVRYTGKTELRLCHGTVLVFDEFTDERSVQ